MQDLCEREVVDLHVFLRDWLAGTLPRTAEAFGRFDGVIGDDFFIVSPRGTRTERAPLIEEFEGAHGAMAENARSFEIWVENYRFHRLIGDHALVTYEEWHRAGDETSARLSTVLFGPPRGCAPTASNGCMCTRPGCPIWRPRPANASRGRPASRRSGFRTGRSGSRGVSKPIPGASGGATVPSTTRSSSPKPPNGWKFMRVAFGAAEAESGGDMQPK